MSVDWRKETRGMECQYGEDLFIAGESKIVMQEDGEWSTRSGEVVLADGTRAFAVLDFCDMDAGEHYGTIVFTPHGTWQPPNGSLPEGKEKSDVFPYRYRYDGRMARDHHVGADGWSQ